MPFLRKPRVDELSQLPKLSDEQLVEEMRAGSHDALAAMFDRYERLVLSVALRIIKDIGEAEEVMQAVFFELYRAAARFDPSRGTVKTWVLQYTRSRSINRRQQLMLHNHYSTLDVQLIEPEALPHTMQLNEAEVRHLIREALGTLSHGQRTVLHKAYFEGMSLKEIAEQTGETFGNVRHHYYRGLARLKAALSEEEESRLGVSKGGVVDAEA